MVDGICEVYYVGYERPCENKATHSVGSQVCAHEHIDSTPMLICETHRTYTVYCSKCLTSTGEAIPSNFLDVTPLHDTIDLITT